MTEPRHAHEAPAPAAGGRSVGFAVITVSDTRTLETDVSGALAVQLIEGAGHAVASRALVKDDEGAIDAAVRGALANAAVQIVFLTGGTGISARDTTPDAVERLLERRLPGFGELFRQLSYEEIGTATILSRATAGVRGGKAVFAAPGSRGAVKLALERILLPEAGHLAAELRKQS
jgi:molybdenum cofactor biosynthesis protein B